MDFSQLILEYQFKTQNKQKGELWWKDADWNNSRKVKPAHLVERSFSKRDFILSLSSRWESSFKWCQQNRLLRPEMPKCETCKQDMELGPLGNGIKND